MFYLKYFSKGYKIIFFKEIFNKRKEEENINE